MGQCDVALRLVVIDPDENFRAELRSLVQLGIDVVFADQPALADGALAWTHNDVVVVCVETPSALALVATICKHKLAPPVIAVGGAGFDGKSLEHVLLLAEVRGAVATLPKPIAAPELVLIATQAQRRFARRENRDGHEPDLVRNQVEAS